MHRHCTRILAAATLTLSLGAVAAPMAAADTVSKPSAKPIAICITIPLPGSADWVGCF